MDPPFRERFRWRRATPAGAEPPGPRGRMASAGALFLATGAIFALISVLTPDAATNDQELLLALAAVAAAMAAGLILVYDRLPIWVFHAGTLAGAAYAVALAAESPPGTQVDGWIAAVGTLLAAGLLVAALRHLLAGTIARLTEASHRD